MGDVNSRAFVADRGRIVPARQVTRVENDDRSETARIIVVDRNTTFVDCAGIIVQLVFF